MTWEKMKRELQRKYLPTYYRQNLFLRLQYLQQGELSVETYTTEFEQLMLKCDRSYFEFLMFCSTCLLFAITWFWLSRAPSLWLHLQVNSFAD